MKTSTKFFLLGLFTLLILGCNQDFGQNRKHIFKVKLEHHLISKGDNRPDFNPYRDSVDYFLYALHTGMSEKLFAREAGWDENQLVKNINQLIQSGFLKRTKQGKLVPACMIVTQADGREIYQASEQVAVEVAKALHNFIPRLEELYVNLSFSTRFNFEELSFFLVSDVLLDNWQINNVEKYFVKAERTLRHGRNYYYQIAELDTTTNVETFGIYGNQVQCGTDMCAAVYGNRRSGIQLQNYYADTTIPYLIPQDEKIFEQMADLFLPELLKVLEKHRSFFEKIYKESKYRDVISFEEYFMWWYHFIYTRATNICAENKLIKIPASGNFFYRGK